MAKVMLLRFLFLLAPLCLITACSGGKNDMFSFLSGHETIERLPGERVSVMQKETQLESDHSISEPLDIPAAALNDSWPQHGGAELMGLGNLSLEFPFNTVRHAEAGKGDLYRFRLLISPVVGDSRVYAMDANGHISAHDALNIEKKLWEIPGVTNHDEPIIGGGLAYQEGKLYASSGKGLVAGFNAETGQELWRQWLSIPIRSAPRVRGGRVYVVTVDSQLYALDATSGAILWSHRGVNEGTGFLIEASPIATQEIVVVPYSSGEIHALRPEDGTEAWSDVIMGPQRLSATSLFTGIGGDPVMVDDVLYVAGSARLFAAIEASTGRRLWEQQVSSVNTPWVAGNSVYLLTTDANVVALNRLDGRVRWVHQLPAYDDPDDKNTAFHWSGPVMAGGKIIIAGAHGRLVVLNSESGEQDRVISIPDGIYTAPVVAGGTLYFVAQDATLHALK